MSTVPSDQRQRQWRFVFARLILYGLKGVLVCLSRSSLIVPLPYFFAALLYLAEIISTSTWVSNYPVNYEIACVSCRTTGAAQGQIYTVWGRSSCPAGQTLLCR